MPLRIGVNALYLLPGGVGGTEIYLRHLLASLAATDDVNHYFVLTNRETTGLVPASPRMHPLPQGVAGRIRPARILWEQCVVPGVAGGQRFDVLLNPGFTAPLICPCPQVTVFHDLQHKRHPEHFRWFDLPFWNALLYGSARRSTRLIAVSEATRQDLVRFYGRDARVILHGVEPGIFDIARDRHPDRFLLCVSTLHPHKGIETLVEAFAAFRAARPGFRLVLAGMRGFAAAQIESQIRGLDLSSAIEVTGWLPRAEIYNLYRRAWAFVYPSLFEGFGMPVAEAMAAGVPVACSDIEPLRTVAGGGALLFPPGDQEGLRDALDRITSDELLRAQLVEAGRRSAARFTWESAAIETRAVLEQAAGARRPVPPGTAR